MEYRFKGNGTVWNAKANKPLCTFKNGEYSTENEEEKNTLIRLGYECINGVLEKTQDELIAIAKSLNIRSPHLFSKDNLILRIRQVNQNVLD